MAGAATDFPDLPGMDAAQYQRLRNVFDVQSQVFAAEILPTIWDRYPDGLHHLSLLDVGARTGAGSDMLRSLHHRDSFSRIKLDVTALDIDAGYRAYTEHRFPELDFRYADIFDAAVSEAYDIVLCSHCIEHVEDPEGFLRRLRELARGWVVVAAPFDEQDLIPGHLHRLDYAFFQRTAAHSLKVYRSLTWHGSMACIAVYAGLAGK